MKEYFSHDYNARNDRRIVKLHMKKGLEAVGAYWCIIEMIHEEGGYLKIDDYERIAFELRISPELIRSIVEDYELFTNDNKLFWSESALRRIKFRTDKSEKARKSVAKRWEKKYERNTNVEQTNMERNTIKVKESKLKEKKEDTKRISFSESKEGKTENSDRDRIFLEVLKTFYFKDFFDPRQVVETFFHHYEKTGWKDSNGNKIENIIAAAENWENKTTIGTHSPLRHMERWKKIYNEVKKQIPECWILLSVYATKFEDNVLTIRGKEKDINKIENNNELIGVLQPAIYAEFGKVTIKYEFID